MRSSIQLNKLYKYSDDTDFFLSLTGDLIFIGRDPRRNDLMAWDVNLTRGFQGRVESDALNNLTEVTFDRGTEWELIHKDPFVITILSPSNEEFEIINYLNSIVIHQYEVTTGHIYHLGKKYFYISEKEHHLALGWLTNQDSNELVELEGPELAQARLEFEKLISNPKYPEQYDWV